MDKALVFFGIAIDVATADVLSVEANELSEYYMHRSQVFDALGMSEHAKMDMVKI